MDASRIRRCRRDLLKQAAAWIVSLGAIPLIARSSPAVAAKVARDIVQYRDEPRNGKVCAGCWAYVPGPNPERGLCRVVEGSISPNGWCMAFSPRRGHTKARIVTQRPSPGRDRAT